MVHRRQWLERHREVPDSPPSGRQGPDPRPPRRGRAPSLPDKRPSQEISKSLIKKSKSKTGDDQQQQGYLINDGIESSSAGSASDAAYSVARFSPTPAVLHEMVQVGEVIKPCMFLQLDAGKKAKNKAKETLRLHSKVNLEE